MPRRTGDRGEATGGRLSRFARRLLTEWRAHGLPRTKVRVVVAASGGADSTALVLALDELSKRGLLAVELKIAHLDHGLRGRAGAADARWVAQLARGLGYEFESARARVGSRARVARDNLEQAARRERYEFLSRVARGWGASLVVTGHTLDDQAETVLLALLRGSGAVGLGGMRAVRALHEDARPGAGEEPRVLLARPLLSWARRGETKSYCVARGVGAREDAMNEDERFARVRVRRRLVPLLETFNPRAVEALARAAGLLRDDSAALDAQAATLLARAAEAGTQPPAAGRGAADANCAALRVAVFAGEPSAVRRRALRLWLARCRGDLRRVELAHVVAVEKLIEGERGGRVAELPGGGRVERRGRWILFRGGEGARRVPASGSSRFR
ncbi:MAG: tRNA lysidine(34) synthetase TilS [Acidobacteria bacterium]|nr:tRNA lysidine(34) synthetase TilS [Acidobacteriota bacterium]